MKKYILFDLDGTLTNPELGIINSVIYALGKFSIEVKDRTSLYSFIGPPLVDSFMDKFGFSKQDAEKALLIYREYFGVKGLFENEVYDGIPEMLEKLKNSGKKIILATSKPEEYAIRIIEHFSVSKYIDTVAGATMDEKRNKKDEIIEYALSLTGCNPDEAVMVGDRKYDVEGANKNGICSVGVLYGFGSEEELLTSGADYTVKTVKELEKLLLGM